MSHISNAIHKIYTSSANTRLLGKVGMLENYSAKFEFMHIRHIVKNSSCIGERKKWRTWNVIEDIIEIVHPANGVCIVYMYYTCNVSYCIM